MCVRTTSKFQSFDKTDEITNSFLFLILTCFFLYRSNLFNVDFLCNLNVSPVPSHSLNSFIRSEIRPLVKNRHIELVSTLKMFFISMILSLLILSTLDRSLYCYRFVSLNTSTNTLTRASKRFSSSYRNLLLLILLYFIIFDFYFVIILPREFFGVQFLNKGRMKHAFRFVKMFQCCFFNISLYEEDSLPHFCRFNLFSLIPM